MNDTVQFVVQNNSIGVLGTNYRLLHATPYTIVSTNARIFEATAGDVITLVGRNQTGARGTIGSNPVMAGITLRKLSA